MDALFVNGWFSVIAGIVPANVAGKAASFKICNSAAPHVVEFVAGAPAA